MTDIELYITVKELSEIDISGACILKSKNTLNRQCNIIIDASGASKIFLDLKLQRIWILDLSGASKLTLRWQLQEI